jgi:hypothetical protein
MKKTLFLLPILTLLISSNILASSFLKFRFETRDSTPQYLLKGSLKTDKAQAATGVTLSAFLNSNLVGVVKSDSRGDFLFNLRIGVTYLVKPEKFDGDDKYKGITSFDVSRIQRHLLGIDSFTSSYQYLAADVDRNGEVDGADILHLRNFILRKTNNLPAGVWRFVDKRYVFKNENPLLDNVPEAILSSWDKFINPDFIAIKIGDVNGTYYSN